MVIDATKENGWSRSIVTMQIESDLYQRQVTAKKIANFTSTLPSTESDFAEQILKDPFEKYKEEMARAMPEPTNIRNEVDTITLDGALSYLAEHGYLISKAKMYKLTSCEEIPCSKFGQKLVFSKKELLHWAESQSKPKRSKMEAIQTLAKSAKRKMKE